MPSTLHVLRLTALLFLAGCSGTPQQETSIGSIPDWVLHPQIEDGIAVSECVLFSGSMSIDKHQAIANARAALAQRIESSISAMDKTYRDKVAVQAGMESGTTFSSVAKQVTQQTLVGTTLMKADVLEIAGQDNLCVLVAIGQESTKAIFDNLLSAANRPMSAEQKGLLFEEFKAQRAEQQLDTELAK